MCDHHTNILLSYCLLHWIVHVTSAYWLGPYDVLLPTIDLWPGVSIQVMEEPSFASADFWEGALQRQVQGGQLVSPLKFFHAWFRKYFWALVGKCHPSDSHSAFCLNWCPKSQSSKARLVEQWQRVPMVPFLRERLGGLGGGGEKRWCRIMNRVEVKYQKTYIQVSDLTVAGFMTLAWMLYINVPFLLWCSEDGRLYVLRSLKIYDFKCCEW